MIACYWCKADVNKVGFHHETYGRTCCKKCFTDQQSNYRKIYGIKASQESVAEEVKRAKGI